MRRNNGSIIFAALLFAAAPAQAFDGPINRGPLADFLNVFRQQAIPRRPCIGAIRNSSAARSSSRPRTVGSITCSATDARSNMASASAASASPGPAKKRFRASASGQTGPPPPMLKRSPDLPRHMAGGMENPLGARALYLGSSQYRIHGSNEPDTIGAAVSSGCIRMTNKTSSISTPREGRDESRRAQLRAPGVCLRAPEFDRFAKRALAPDAIAPGRQRAGVGARRDSGVGS